MVWPVLKLSTDITLLITFYVWVVDTLNLLLQLRNNIWAYSNYRKYVVKVVCSRIHDNIARSNNLRSTNTMALQSKWEQNELRNFDVFLFIILHGEIRTYNSSLIGSAIFACRWVLIPINRVLVVKR